MFDTIKKLLGMKKLILLSVLYTFPDWHSRYGEETEFARKIAGDNPTKIYALKSGVSFWEESCRKFSTGKYILQVAHLENTPKGKVYYSIMRCQYLHMQKACRCNDSDCLLVDGIKIDISKIARNEGLDRDDFMEFLDRFSNKEFCIVHFTDFRYSKADMKKETKEKQEKQSRYRI